MLCVVLIMVITMNRSTTLAAILAPTDLERVSDVPDEESFGVDVPRVEDDAQIRQRSQESTMNV